MEFIFELLLELILEVGIDATSNKKISKWIRYPLAAIIILFFLTGIVAIILLGIVCLRENIIGGLFLIAIGLFLLIAGILKFTKMYRTIKKVITG